jgi:hypothetical protein
MPNEQDREPGASGAQDAGAPSRADDAGAIGQSRSGSPGHGSSTGDPEPGLPGSLEELRSLIFDRLETTRSSLLQMVEQVSAAAERRAAQVRVELERVAAEREQAVRADVERQTAEREAQLRYEAEAAATAREAAVREELEGQAAAREATLRAEADRESREREMAAPAALAPSAPPTLPVPERAGSLALCMAVLRLDEAPTQAEILARLLEECTIFASRVALLLVEGEQDEARRLVVWSATGFDPEPAGLVLPFPAAWGQLAGKPLTGSAATLGVGSELGGDGARCSLAVPFVLRDLTRAILYADQLEAEHRFDASALQLLCFVGAQLIETLPVRQKRPAATLEQPGQGADEPWTPPAIRESATRESGGVVEAGLEEGWLPPSVRATPSLDRPSLPGATAEDFARETAGVEDLEGLEGEKEMQENARTEAASTLAPGVSPVSGWEGDLSAAGELDSAGVRESSPSEGFEPAFELEPKPDREGSGADSTVEVSAAARGLAAPQEPAEWELGVESEVEPGEVDAAATVVLPPLLPPPPPRSTLPHLDPSAAAPAEPATEHFAVPVPPALTTGPIPIQPAGTQPGVDVSPFSDLRPSSEIRSPFDDLGRGLGPRLPAPPPAPPQPPQPPARASLVGESQESAAERSPKRVSPPLSRGLGAEVAAPVDAAGPGLAFRQQASADDELHAEARRLARLLVSELKLYNEEEIEEGRRAGNIYRYLKDAIERSRTMYDERIDDRVRTEADYFREELIRSIAGGDAKLLGI